MRNSVAESEVVREGDFWFALMGGSEEEKILDIGRGLIGWLVFICSSRLGGFLAYFSCYPEIIYISSPTTFLHTTSASSS